MIKIFLDFSAAGLEFYTKGITPAAKKSFCEALIHFVLDAPTDGHHGHRVVNVEAEAQKAKKGLHWGEVRHPNTP